MAESPYGIIYVGQDGAIAGNGYSYALTALRLREMLGRAGLSSGD